MTKFVFNMLKSLVFVPFSLSFLFEFLLLHTSSPAFTPPPSPVLSCPLFVGCLCHQRESLESVKLRLVREQQGRIDRRVRQLLQLDREVSGESEEENRLLGRRARGQYDDNTPPYSPSSKSFCCGVLVGVLVVVYLLCCLIYFSLNGRKRMER